MKSSREQGAHPMNPFTSPTIPPEFCGPGEDENTRQQATQRSEKIDASLREARKLLEKKKKGIHILLLGQSESGKSSILKNFQLAFAPTRFQAERSAWKTIIQLNLIGSLKQILSVLEKADEDKPAPESSTAKPLTISPNLRRIRRGLTPLLSIETSIKILLSPQLPSSKHVSVQAGSGWKSILGARTVADEMPSPRDSAILHNNDPALVLAASKDDIKVLWEDATVRNILHAKDVRLEHEPGFFLDDIDRVSAIDYTPTDCDIVKARVQTMGAEEHHLVVESGPDAGADVYITDVGGSRSVRASWAPYFEHVHAILFIAPLAFSEYLEEDRRINRLEDSLMLWRDMCANKLLENCQIILFLNKMDVLDAKLKSGCKVSKYVPSYGDTPNDRENVVKYFRDRFHSYHRKHSPIPRAFMCFETSAIDTSMTTSLLIGVRDAILRKNLHVLQLE